MRNVRTTLGLLVLASLVTACGASGGDSRDVTPAPPPTSYGRFRCYPFYLHDADHVSYLSVANVSDYDYEVHVRARGV